MGGDIIKRALYNACKAGLRAVLTVHDEIVLDTLTPDEDMIKLQDIMLEAERFYCPNVAGKVVSKITKRYEK
jgi:hypothetical protein